MIAPEKKAKWTLSPLWIFPLLTALAAGYLVFDTYKDRGPLVTIRFAEAANIEAGKSPLRYRGVTIGTIETISFGDDMKEVVVEARLLKSAKGLARVGSKFVLIQPQISLQGIQGLDTIVSGSYIRVEPGDGAPSSDFHGELVEQIGNNKVGKVTFIIRSKQLFSISTGDPITYRGLTVGSVSHVDLAKNGQWLEINADIERRYQHLIRRNTVFWRASGMQANLGLFSSKVDISSLEALMKGAVGFATPTKSADVAKPGQVFSLLGQAPEGWQSWTPTLSSL